MNRINRYSPHQESDNTHPSDYFTISSEKPLTEMDDSTFGNSTYSANSLGSLVTVLILSGFGFFENGMVVVLLFTRSRLRKRPHVFFILCLSCIDLIIALNIILLTAANFTPLIRSRIFCGAMFVCVIIFFGMSLIQALIIAIERYFAVTATSRYVSYFSGWKKYLLVLTCFVTLTAYVVILVIGFPPILTPQSCNEVFLFDYWEKFIITICTQGIFIPVILAIIIIYAVSIMKLRKRIRQIGSISTFAGNSTTNTDLSNRRMPMAKITLPTVTPTTTSSTSNQNTHFHDQPSSSGTLTRETRTPRLPNKKASISKLIKAVKSVAIIEALLLICFVPHSVAKLVILHNEQVHYVTSITKLLPALHPVLNPILYVFCVPDFRKELKCCR